MTGGGYVNHEGKIEIGELSPATTPCHDFLDFHIAENYAAVGTFVNGRGLICGGYKATVGDLYRPVTSNRCFSWNPEVSLHILVIIRILVRLEAMLKAQKIRKKAKRMHTDKRV